jgi:T-complex protein 1 subunit gamma
LNPKLVPGGGALEMQIACRLSELSTKVEGVQQWPMKALANAFEVIPRTLAANCGADVVRTITELRAKHATKEGLKWGIQGNTGKIADMVAEDVWDPIVVKVQTYKTAIESACMLLRIDDIVSGLKKPREQKSAPAGEDGDAEEGFGDARDG